MVRSPCLCRSRNPPCCLITIKSWGGRGKARAFFASLLAHGAEPAGLGFVSATLPYTLGALEVIPGVIATSHMRNNKPALKARDPGSPAALILMMRRARQAQAENPNHPQVYLAIYDACNALLNEQEEYWANYTGDPRFAGGLRKAIRRIQTFTALKTYLDMHPENFQIQDQMAKMFLQINYLDVALEHFKMAERLYEQYYQTLTDPKSRDFAKKQLEAVNKRTQSLEDEVKNRRDSYLLEAATKKGLDKYALAMNRGLALDPLQQFRHINIQELAPKNREARDFLLARLLMQMGRANFLTETIAKTGPAFAEFRALHAAALGNYGDLDKALAELEKMHEGNWVPGLSKSAVDLIGLSQGITDSLPFIARTSVSLLVFQRAQENLAGPVAEMLSLRGIMALEQGDTAAARKHLEDSLAMDRPGWSFCRIAPSWNGIWNYCASARIYRLGFIVSRSPGAMPCEREPINQKRVNSIPRPFLELFSRSSPCPFYPRPRGLGPGKSEGGRWLCHVGPAWPGLSPGRGVGRHPAG